MSRVGYKEYLRKMMNDSDQGELTVETVLDELEEYLKDKYGGRAYLNYDYYSIKELPSFKNKDFKKVGDEMISKHKNKVVQLAKDINLIRMTDELGTPDYYMKGLANVLIKNYFKYIIIHNGDNYGYRDKSEAISDIDEMYSDYTQGADDPDPKEFMEDYKLKGFTYMPSND